MKKIINSRPDLVTICSLQPAGQDRSSLFSKQDITKLTGQKNNYLLKMKDF